MEEDYQTVFAKRQRHRRMPRPVKDTVLVIPKEEETRPLDELRKNKAVVPLKLGVRRVITFPSGSVLISCEKVKEMKTLVQKCETIAIKEQRAPSLLEINILGVPADYTAD